MQQNLKIFDRIVRFLIAVFLFFAAGVLFQNPFARFLAAVLGLGSLTEGLFAKCPLLARLGVDSVSEDIKNESLYFLGLLGIQAALAYEWWNAGWEKISSPDFVSKISDTLGFFASKNPFSWYKDFLTGFASQNSTAFAYAVEWSEIGIALALFISVAVLLWSRNNALRRWVMGVSVLALVGGAIMNANFYFAAGWTGPGTKASNLVMFWPQLVLIYVWLTALLSKKVD